jgi:hypothetical protein
MSEPTQEPTLAERLRAYRKAVENAKKASDERHHAASFVPQEYLYPYLRADDYLRGHDDATREAAAMIDALEVHRNDDALRIESLTARVRELEAARNDTAAALALANQQQQAYYARLQELEAQLADAKKERIPSWHKSPSAVGVVGEVRYGVEHNAGCMHQWTYRNETSARAARDGFAFGRVVAIVDPDAIVPLASKEPQAWRDDITGIAFDTRELAADCCDTTVTPLYPGLAQPAREES